MASEFNAPLAAAMAASTTWLRFSRRVQLAEETGLILRVAEWVLWAAYAQGVASQADRYSGLRVTVNFSSRQFEYENILELIKKALKETRFAPETLELEITENMAIRDGELGARTLNELGAIRIRFSIDDFGIDFFGSFKQDHVYQACLETMEEVKGQVPEWIEHYNRQAPHRALGMRSPVGFYEEWMVKNKTQPAQN